MITCLVFYQPRCYMTQVIQPKMLHVPCWESTNGPGDPGAPRPCAPVLPRSHCLPGAQCDQGVQKHEKHGEVHAKNAGKRVEIMLNLIELRETKRVDQ